MYIVGQYVLCTVNAVYQQACKVTYPCFHQLCSVCHCQENENILASASGDGSIKIWDLSAPPQANPLRSFEEHTREVGSTL